MVLPRFNVAPLEIIPIAEVDERKICESQRFLSSRYAQNSREVVHGNIQVEDVERVSRYARRVKILLFRASEIRPTQHLYLQLSQLVPAPLFPSLRRLESPTAQKVSDVMEGILIALSPALRVLTFNSLTVAEDALVGAFISSLAVKTTSNLTHLVLYGHVSTDTLLHVFEFENLQSLELALLQDVAANVFTLLDKLENLSNLTIDVQRCSVIPSRVAPPTSPRRSRHSFPPSPTLKSLKKLHVSGKPVDIVLVLSGTRPSHLQYFSVECYHDTSYVGCSPTMMRCLEGYVFRSHPSLCTFNFMHHPPLTSKCHFSLTDLPNITSLHSLENFSLETSLFSADIGKLEEFVSAWPNLKILILPLFWSDAVPTLTFLATLRTFCPRLQEVHLPLIPEIPTLLPANISAYHPLKKLSVTPIEFDQEATFENQLRVSQFITQLFPDAAVDLRRTSNSTSTGFWEKVQATVKLCQEVRKRTISFTVNRHKVIAR